MYYKIIILIAMFSFATGCSGIDGIFGYNKTLPNKEYFSENRPDLSFPPDFKDMPSMDHEKIKSNIGKSLINDLDTQGNKK